MVILLMLFCFYALLHAQKKLNIKTMLSFKHRSNDLIVRFVAGTTEEQKQLIFQQLQVISHKKLKIVPDLYYLKLKTRSSLESSLRWVLQNREIMYAEPNYERKLYQEPNDPHYTNDDLWGLKKIHCPAAWDISTSSNIIVAVLDTGVDYRHEDLKQNMWVNEAELNGEPNKDDDGDGYKDDTYGYDFVNEDSDPMDDGDNHGVHVAGTIGAMGNNNLGITGICWSVKIMALKFIDGINGPISAEIEGIEYAIQHGSKIINMSFGGTAFSQAEKDAIQKAAQQGVICVVAAGNEGANNDETPSYPASYDLDNIISVAASDSNDDLASFSNYGAKSVDLLAPGVGIWSTVISDGYQTEDGTSMAAPHVAGCLALLWSRFPNLSYRQIIGKLLRNVDKVPASRSAVATGGRLNISKALRDVEEKKQDFGKGGGGCSPCHTSEFNIGELMPFLLLILFGIWRSHRVTAS